LFVCLFFSILKQIMKKSLYTLLFAAGLANSVLAQGFQVNFQGQKQQGTGCAGSAKYVDGSSLFFNPGASAFAEESSANVAMTPVFALLPPNRPWGVFPEKGWLRSFPLPDLGRCVSFF
jgi:hypothetical protein